MSTNKPNVLLVNDDGPPGPESPYIFGFYQHLVNDLSEFSTGRISLSNLASMATCYVMMIPLPDWNVKVVVPSSQKSWIGKAYHIKEITRGGYFYPIQPDGVEGETSSTRRQLKDGEVAEWILLDGTPATCTNVALHNIYPGEIDLVISGPNFGRNTSAAFSLSSGTIGAAMSAALSRKRAIALSYGTVLRPTPIELHGPAYKLSVRIVEYLWNNWGKDPNGIRNGEVDLYSVNLPMIHQLTNPGGLEVHWTRMWRNSYGRLFARVPTSSETEKEMPPEGDAPLAFKFAPEIRPLINPDLSVIPMGTDGWAFAMGHASITPMKACFAEVDDESGNDQGRLGKVHL